MVKIEQTGGKLTEEEILHGKNDTYGIYQIDWHGEGKEYAFLSFDSIRAKGKIPERKDYQLVYSGILGNDENMDSLYENSILHIPMILGGIRFQSVTLLF